MKKFLVMRSKQRSKALSDFLLKKNCQVFHQSLIKISKFSTNNFLEKFDYQKFSVVIITSQNAVEAMSKLIDNRNIKIFAVGKKTALKLNSYGFVNVEYPKKYQVENLISMVLNYKFKVDDKIIYFRGEKIANDLAKIFLSHRLNFYELIVYKTIAIKSLSANFIEQIKFSKNFNIIILSLSSLEIFLFLAKKHNLLEYLSSCNLIVISSKLALKAKKILNEDSIEDFKVGFRFKKIEIFADNEILKNYL